MVVGLLPFQVQDMLIHRTMVIIGIMLEKWVVLLQEIV